ncbi:alpha/beta hydrolase [Myroides sp. LJL116]
METSLSIPYLVQKPEVIKDENPLILLLHGYGSNEQDLFSFAQELPKEYFIVSAQAPYPVPPYGHAWYAIHFDQDANKFSDDQQAITSRDLIAQFIEELCIKYPIDKKRVNLVGFSQGAILSYAVGLSYPEKVKNIVALSGYFNANIIKSGFENNDFSRLKVFASHGSVDQVIPVQWAQQTPAILEKLNIFHQYKEYPVGHGVHPMNFQDFKEFLIKNDHDLP